MLFAYRSLVFLLSAGIHSIALFALLWFGQNLAKAEGLILDFDTIDLAFIVAVMQGVSFLIIISPLGALFQKSYYPVRKLSKRENDKLLPLLNEVMASYKDKIRARVKNVELFIMDDPEWNASAFGRNNIAITSGLFNKLKWRDDALKAVMAHELGHLHHRDLWFWYYVDAAGGALIMLFGLLGVAQRIATGLSDLFLPFIIVSLPLQMAYIMCFFALHIMMFPVQILAKFEVYLSRSLEYRADNFAADIIGTNGVISFLETIKKIEKHMAFGFLNMKSRSHPPSEYRIERLHRHSDYEECVSEKTLKPISNVKRKRQRSNKAHDRMVLPVVKSKNYIPL